MSGHILELREVRKAYGATMAVDGVSISLERGEFLSLLGPSGSGKTTTLSIIAGLTEPSGGEVLLDGRTVTRLPPYKRDIGVVFQNYALFPNMTVAGNIAFPLIMRRRPRSEIATRVSQMLALVGLPQLGERYPRQLSGGQQQRVALARAMVFEPRLLLMDEPLGALDKKLREQMQLEIRRLHRDLGISIVYVTHDQEEALVLSDRVAVFDQGRIEQMGTPDALYETPRTRFVANFLGESNFIPGTLETTDGELGTLNGNGVRLVARNPSGVPVGAGAVISVRPERIRLAPCSDPTGTEVNTMSGTVREVIYLGNSRKFVVSTGAGLEMSVLQQSGREQGPALQPSQPVRLSWMADDATVLS